ncbi:MAG: helix-turn-helix transcriptional regulator [Vulcanimicrobiaceae bacterium]
MWALMLRDSPSRILDAYRAFLRGERSEALDALKYEPLTPARAIVEAHILYWNRQRREAATVLANGIRIWGLAEGDPRIALARAMRSAALASLGETALAAKLVTDVDPTSYRAASEFPELAFYLALSAWALKRYEESALLLNLIVEDEPERNIYARCLVLRGWLQAASGQIDAQIELTIAALDVLDGSEEPDLGLMGMALRILATLARDRLDRRALDTVIERASFPWTADLALERFQVTRMAAWAHAMHGDYIRAGGELNAARRLAPSPYMQMVSHLDRAWLAQISREDLHVRLELREAEWCASQINWNDAADEEVGALILAAELAAPVDPAKGQAFLDQAHATPISQSAGFAHDARLRAFRLTAESAVLKARGQRRTAILRATEALNIFTDVGYRWRAANLALSLHEMTGEMSWLEVIEDVSAAYPRSFIAAEYERLSTAGRSPIEALTNRQREIVSLIRDEGLSNERIALRLSMSSNTVRIHKQKIFRAFKVSNEFQLLAKLNSLAS